MSELLQKQFIFTQFLSKLLQKFSDLDIQVGEAWRSPETCELYEQMGKGVGNSTHQIRLAIDINLWVNGELSNKKSDYQPLADFWKGLPATTPSDVPIMTCWGGDFHTLCDIYHFSIEHNGVR